MKKKVLLIVSVLLSPGLFCACNNSDDTSDVLIIEKTIADASNDSQTVDKGANDASDVAQSIGKEIGETTIEGLSFFLFHEDGGESLIFKTGDPLVFQLAFETFGNPVLSQDLKEGDLIADQDLFAIYRENGEKVGLPQWDRITMTAFETAVGPYVYRYIWSTSNGDNLLEPGNYYTQFSIMYNANVGQSNKQMEKKDIKVNFKIQ